MEILAAISDGAAPVPHQFEESLVQSFVSAVKLTLAEMAGTEPFAQGSFRRTQPLAIGDFSAIIRFLGGNDGFILSFPAATARAVSKRILAHVAEGVDESLLRDCLGEIANVIAGQAKALLAETPYHFAFSTPTVVAGSLGTIQLSANVLAIAFLCEFGDFGLQVCLNRLDAE